MSKFDEREKSFEKKFQMDEELKFKVQSRSNKYLAEFVSEKLPEVLPSPIVPLSETFRVVVAVPEVIFPVELKDILLEVIVNALLLVVRVLPLEIEKLPAPSPSESEMRLVVPFVVKFEESVMPFWVNH